MLGLVLAHNLLQTYVFWELVGSGSYLLIGFWFEKPEAGRAALKAFWTTRLGDVGFAIGIVVALVRRRGRSRFTDLFAQAESGALGGTALTLGVAGIYLGAMGKSAQFPFHIWLPDAMEGPTPVSALIHAATMVAAGVYLMVRIAPLLAHTPEVATAVFAIGVLDRAPRGVDGARRERHQAHPGVFDRQPARLHDGGLSARARPPPPTSTSSRTRSSRRCCSWRPAR